MCGVHVSLILVFQIVVVVVAVVTRYIVFKKDRGGVKRGTHILWVVQWFLVSSTFNNENKNNNTILVGKIT